MKKFRVGHKGVYSSTSQVVEADDFSYDSDGYLTIVRDREEVAVFAPGNWNYIWEVVEDNSDVLR